eukprot:3511779-Lingulodinium_polyedra.AAC.1
MADATPRSVQGGLDDAGGRCKWCSRPFGILVPRRRERGSECRTCPVTIVEEFPEEARGKSEFANKVAGDIALQSQIRE